MHIKYPNLFYMFNPKGFPVLFLSCFVLCICLNFSAKAQNFTRQDSLRGSLRPERTCYDVFFYDLHVRVNPKKRYISGSNTMHYRVLAPYDVIQIDLFENMDIDKITHQGRELDFKREGNATFVQFGNMQAGSGMDSIKIEYSGKPRMAIRPPWDGGFSWEKDAKDRPWIGVSCQSLGASVWWPNKDHLTEEPDSMRITCEVPQGLDCIANGNLRSKTKLSDGYTQFEWFVSYPINNYNVTLNIGHYTHIADTFKNADGTTMELDYYVLDYNREKAIKHFAEVKPMLACYEEKLGKYPFWKDGFALVETYYLGMEHQGAIAYGNKYMKGYLGSDLSQSGYGLKFDYITIHESGHEWWGNHVSTHDEGELWIHESFCTYTESLFVECMFGKEAAYQYAYGFRHNVGNQNPVVGPLGVNKRGDDIYNKGTLLLHTFRNVLQDDALWFRILKGIQKEFGMQVITTDMLLDYINKESGEDYSYYFQQYLYRANIPVLEYKINPGPGPEVVLEYRWQKVVDDFRMPVQILMADGSYKTIQPELGWQKEKVSLKGKKFQLKPNSYYIKTKKKS